MGSQVCREGGYAGCDFGREGAFMVGVEGGAEGAVGEVEGCEDEG